MVAVPTTVMIPVPGVAAVRPLKDGDALRLYGSSSGYVGLVPAAAAGAITYTLPAADGTIGQVLSTNGSAVLSWASAGGTPGGTTRQVQFNNAGTFDGSAQIEYELTTGRLITSGIVWTGRSATEANSWNGVAYGNGLFVSVSSTGTNRVMTSPDGKVWTARSAAEANLWQAVAYGNGVFVAVSQNGTNRVMTSPDGKTWTARVAAEANQWVAITYGKGLFVAIANTGTNRVMTSPDGVTWTARAASEANNWQSIVYANDIFVAVSQDGTNRVMTSTDTITWTARSAAEANQWNGITYGNGLFVSVASTGTNRVMTSPDGINWTVRSASDAKAWFSIAFGNGLFAVVSGSSGDLTTMTSPDGINWTSRTITETSSWLSVTYGQGIFVTVASSGTNRVMTSGVKLDHNELSLVSTLGPTRGGTNQTTYVTGDLLYSSATDTIAKLGIGSTSQVLTVVGGVPAWAAAAGGGITIDTTAITGGAANRILLESGTNKVSESPNLTYDGTKLNIVGTGEQFRMSYDATYFTTYKVNSLGRVEISPNAGLSGSQNIFNIKPLAVGGAGFHYPFSVQSPAGVNLFRVDSSGSCSAVEISPTGGSLTSTSNSSFLIKSSFGTGAGPGMTFQNISGAHTTAYRFEDGGVQLLNLMGTGELRLTPAASALGLNITANATPGSYISCLTSAAAHVFLVNSTGAVTANNATGGLGYGTGAGGTVTQTTTRTTGVTLNNVCGSITLVSAAGSPTPASFTVTNSTIAATDTIVLSQQSGTDKYNLKVTAVAAGSFQITFHTDGGTTVETPVFNFAKLSSVAA